MSFPIEVYMLKFLKEHSYDAVKLFVTQCAISIFGLVLTLACVLAENDTLKIFCSVFAILFYLFLLYTSMWEKGSKDHIAVEYGRKAYQPLLGLKVSLLANSLNLLLAVLLTIGAIASQGSALANMGDNCRSIAVLLQGMYTGLLSLPGGGAEHLNQLWFMYWLIPLPAMLISTLGYYFGVKNIKFTKFFDAKPPRQDGES